MERPIHIGKKIIVLLLSAGIALPYSYSLFGPMTGERTIGLSGAVPLTITPAFRAAVELRAAYGIFENLDVTGDVLSLSVYPFQYVSSSIAPRFHFGGGHIAALMLGVRYTTNGYSFTFAPQYHFYGESGILAIGILASADFTAAALGNPVFSATIAPEVKIIRGVLHMFIECTPAYTLGASNALTLTASPGVWFSFGEKPAHRITLCLPVTHLETVGTIPNTVGYEIRLRYSTAFTL